MRAETADGSIPPDLKLAIIDPGTGAMTKQAPAIDTAKLPSAKKADNGGGDPQASGVTTLEGDGVSDDVTLSAMKRSPKPTIYSRAQWGANERMREQTPPSYGTVKTGFIHHTVNANNYTRAQVPALLRGIYAYHTQSRGWRDIGYNYLVDRFGRIWEGRWGGVDRAVVGAHTLGYNEVSFAMSAIGNFDIAKPPTGGRWPPTRRLFAWKLSIYNIRATNPRIVVKGRYLQGDQRPPRRGPDGLSGPLPLRPAALHPQPGPRDPGRRAEGRGVGTPAPPPRAPPPGPDVHLADPDAACRPRRSRRSPSRGR